MEIQINENTVGVALLVSNDYDPKYWNEVNGKHLGELFFTHKDVENLALLFEDFAYAVYRKKNVTRERFVTYYAALADYKYPPTCKRILVYFSGHGDDDGKLILQDGDEVDIKDVICRFRINIANNETLAETIKMFFFDACRGSSIDGGYAITPEAKTAGDAAGRPNALMRVPKEGNTLVAYASAPHHKSFADSNGSYWTNCLVKALRESNEKDDVCNILTKANDYLRKRTSNQNSFQTAEFISNLTTLVCFKREASKIEVRILFV